MKAVRVNEFGPPEVLVAEELPEPRAGDGRVVVDIGAIGVNFMETRLRAGVFAGPTGQKPPFVPGNEVGGVVAEVGPGVDATLVGRRVVTGTGGRGGYAERVAVAAEGLVEIPDGMETETAVALFAHGRTAVGLVREMLAQEKKYRLKSWISNGYHADDFREGLAEDAAGGHEGAL